MDEKVEILGKGMSYNSLEEGDHWLIRITHNNGDECYFVLKEVAIIHNLRGSEQTARDET